MSLRAKLGALTIAAIFTIGLPSLASAQEGHHEVQRPPPHPGGAPLKPFVAPHGPVPHPGPVVVHPGGPAVVVTGPRFIYRGHKIERGLGLSAMGCRRRAAATLPGAGLLVRGLGGSRLGPDLLLVNVTTGQVVDVAYGVFY